VRAALVVATLLPSLAAADAARQQVALELATEVDSNVHRSLADSGDVEAGVALRGSARWGLAWRPASGHGVGLGITAAGRKLTGGAAAEEDTFLLGTDLRWEARVGEGARLQVGASYHDLFENDTDVDALDVDRDFRTAQGRVGLVVSDPEERWRVSGAAGGRIFAYKPDSSLDFAGATASIELSRTWGRGPDAEPEDGVLVTTLAYQLAHRDFSGVARDPGPDGGTIPTSVGRLDLFHAGSFTAEWQGDFFAAARYELAANRSNSVGQSYFRHRVDLSGTVELGARWACTARLVLQINRAEDDPITGPSGVVPTIEDESKSLLGLHVLRPLSGGLALEARAAFYAGPIDAPTEFGRTVVALGLVWTSRP
jgi:hypothetical protein